MLLDSASKPPLDSCAAMAPASHAAVVVVTPPAKSVRAPPADDAQRRSAEQTSQILHSEAEQQRRDNVLASASAARQSVGRRRIDGECVEHTRGYAAHRSRPGEPTWALPARLEAASAKKRHRRVTPCGG